ncbi:MAG: hypothetical protein NVS4B3_20400 [Gemmatimonadaceae bacterium]
MLILVLVVLVIFGAGRFPAVAKGMGSGIREFKRGRDSDAGTPFGAPSPPLRTKVRPPTVSVSPEPARMEPKRLIV